MDFFINAQFFGGLADEHRLPGYDGSQSILGEARANLIILNFVAEGKVRRRQFRSELYRYELVAQRPGSFESVFQFIADPENLALLKNAGYAVGGGVAANFVYELMKDVKRRVVGKSGSEQIAEMERRGQLQTGQLESLTEAIEPATRAAHTVINHGAAGLTININGDNNVVKFDGSTKSYLWDSVIDNELKAKLFSFSNYDGNYSGGRAFDFDEGRLVSFDTAPGIDRQSIELILDSMSKYALRKFEDNPSAVVAQYTSLHAPDGRLKKIRIYKVRRGFDEI